MEEEQREIREKGFQEGKPGRERSLTVCSLTARHCEWRRMADAPPLSVFLMVPFRCRERWLLPSRPPRPRHRGGREILGVNMAFTAPLRKRSRAERQPEERWSSCFWSNGTEKHTRCPN